MTNEQMELREKIITECTAWSVEYMAEMLDKFESQAIQATREETVEKVKNMSFDMSIFEKPTAAAKVVIDIHKQVLDSLTNIK